MQAYKLKGKIDESGNLIVTEPIKMIPGEVELVVWQTVAVPESDTSSIAAPTSDTSSIPPVEAAKPKRGRPKKEKPKSEVESSIPVLKEWLGKIDPVPPDFDSDRAKWLYLKEKHNL